MKFRTSIYASTAIFGVVAALGLLAILAVSTYSTNQLRVGGPIYDRIKLGNDLVADAARDRAKQADEAAAKGRFLGPLHGLPIAHKDLQDTKGIRTTYGSPIFKDYIPTQNTLTIERIFQAGAIPIGKTNVPEFGAGSQTFNPVFGATKNPYDLTKTCGGSSGGAAVAGDASGQSTLVNVVRTPNAGSGTWSTRPPCTNTAARCRDADQQRRPAQLLRHDRAPWPGVAEEDPCLRAACPHRRPGTAAWLDPRHRDGTRRRRVAGRTHAILRL